MIPDFYDKYAQSDNTQNITDKALIDYEQQLIRELKNQTNFLQSPIEVWKGSP